MLLEKVLSTTQYVVSHSRQVKINQAAVEQLAKKIKNRRPPAWSKSEYHFSGAEPAMIQYLFILDSLDFGLFPEKPTAKWQTIYVKEKIGGYFGLALTVKRAIQKYPLLDCHFLASISLADVQKIFIGHNKLPMLKERQNILQQNAQILLKKFDGQAANIVRQSNHSAQHFLKILFKNFPCFRDTAEFQKHKIYLLKHAQILTADIWGALAGRGLGKFKDINRLTCFADYKIPQILHYFGVLEYAPSLLQKIKNETLITAGSSTEIEIRANTIWAIEMLKKDLAKLGRDLPSFQIDWILWNMSQKIKIATPYHRARTTFY